MSFHISHYGDNLLALHNNLKQNKAVIFITGMANTLLDPPYVRNLYDLCTKLGIFFIQPLFHSHPHFGMYTLEDDCEDLKECIAFFKLHSVCLIGHSTGCQDILYFIDNYNINVLLGILQGPVSDREFESSRTEKLEEYVKYVEKYKKATNEKVPKISRDIFIFRNIPFCKTRFLDLYKKGGRDDMFSSDLVDSYFLTLNKKSVPLLFVLSKNDQFNVKSNYSKLKFVANSNIVELVGNHELRNEGNLFVDAIKSAIVDKMMSAYEIEKMIDIIDKLDINVDKKKREENKESMFMKINRQNGNYKQKMFLYNKNRRLLGKMAKKNSSIEVKTDDNLPNVQNLEEIEKSKDDKNDKNFGNNNSENKKKDDKNNAKIQNNSNNNYENKKKDDKNVINKNYESRSLGAIHLNGKSNTKTQNIKNNEENITKSSNYENKNIENVNYHGNYTNKTFYNKTKNNLERKQKQYKTYAKQFNYNDLLYKNSTNNIYKNNNNNLQNKIKELQRQDVYFMEKIINGSGNRIDFIPRNNFKANYYKDANISKKGNSANVDKNENQNDNIKGPNTQQNLQRKNKYVNNKNYSKNHNYYSMDSKFVNGERVKHGKRSELEQIWNKIVNPELLTEVEYEKKYLNNSDDETSDDSRIQR